MVKILIVCYSLPLNVKFDPDSQTYEFTVHNGGLQNGLQGVKDCSNFLWIGWPGDEIQPTFQTDLRQKLVRDHSFYPIFFNKTDFQTQFLSYCFLCLHPIKHNLIERGQYTKSWWESYSNVNEKFAREVFDLAEDGDLVWIQDFNLAMVPFYLDKLKTTKSVRFKIGFFCHTNFPSPSILSYIPEARQLLDSLSKCDLVGFHCSDHEKNFKDSCASFNIELRGPNTATIPFGINLDRYEKFLSSSKTESKLNELKAKYAGKFVFFGCERADYIKSIDLKLKSFDRFLESNPDLVEKCVLVQISVPCKLFLREMREHAAMLTNLSNEINKKYEGSRHRPIEHEYKSVDFETLMAYYLIADCCVITSISEGLNLVSFEYVYAQEKKVNSGSTPGVLVLSRFAGAAQYFDTPFKINPVDLENQSETYRKVIGLSDHEKLAIQRKLITTVRINTAENWKKRFTENIEFNG